MGQSHPKDLPVALDVGDLTTRVDVPKKMVYEYEGEIPQLIRGTANGLSILDLGATSVPCSKHLQPLVSTRRQ